MAGQSTVQRPPPETSGKGLYTNPIKRLSRLYCHNSPTPSPPRSAQRHSPLSRSKKAWRSVAKPRQKTTKQGYDAQPEASIGPHGPVLTSTSLCLLCVIRRQYVPPRLNAAAAAAYHSQVLVDYVRCQAKHFLMRGRGC